MADVILMPRLSDTMTEGVIAAWHKKVGDKVQKGDLLAEVETDKATMDLESYYDGVLLYVGAQKGEKIEVNKLLAIIGNADENVEELVAQNGGAPSQPAQEKSVPQPSKAEEKPAEPAPAPAASGADISKMEEAILMPRLSDTMTEGVIAAWHKKVGDQVKKGDLLAEVETDKATMDLESYKDGTLLYIGAEKGDKVPVNALLCIIGNESTNVDAIVAAAKGGNAPAEKSSGQQVTTGSLKVPEEAASEDEGTSTGDDGRTKASPLARRLAKEKGIDIRLVKGSGDGGRIIKKDIEEFDPSKAAKPVSSASTATPAAKVIADAPDFEEVPVTQMRKTVARRLSESKFSAPHFYLTMNIDMDKAVASRAQINEISPVKISFNDMVIKAVSIALKQHPKVNSSWLGETIRINHHVNIGVAVAVEDGLLVPVVRSADKKSLSQIAGEVKEFAQKAKNKKLQPSDWEGSTFTISNLGMFGIEEFTAIINPPDACILAVGAINEVPVIKNGEIKVGNVMKVTLSCDHRVVDGATGAAFLQTLKSLLEEPLRMLV
ncbi:MAG TPA: pyruvate dehydrogenase complex dihydrolipoamide acetyltransferase [Parasegetibacter sp.]